MDLQHYTPNDDAVKPASNTPLTLEDSAIQDLLRQLTLAGYEIEPVDGFLSPILEAEAEKDYLLADLPARDQPDDIVQAMEQYNRAYETMKNCSLDLALYLIQIAQYRDVAIVSSPKDGASSSRNSVVYGLRDKIVSQIGRVKNARDLLKARPKQRLKDAVHDREKELVDMVMRYFLPYQDGEE